MVSRVFRVSSVGRISRFCRVSRVSIVGLPIDKREDRIGNRIREDRLCKVYKDY